MLLTTFAIKYLFKTNKFDISKLRTVCAFLFYILTEINYPKHFYKHFIFNNIFIILTL